MIAVDAKNISISDVKKILKGETAIVSHNGRDLFAIVSLDLFKLLTAMQIEELENSVELEELTSEIQNLVNYESDEKS